MVGSGALQGTSCAVLVACKSAYLGAMTASDLEKKMSERGVAASIYDRDTWASSSR